MKNKLHILALSFFCVFAGAHAQDAAPQNLKAVLDAQRGAAQITLAKGVYFLDATYKFENLKDVVFDGNGSEIICRKRTSTFRVSNCENLTLKNFSIDYDPLCYTQAEITDISADGVWTVRFFEGYELPDSKDYKKESMRLFDGKRRALKYDFPTIHGGFEMTAIEAPRTYKITISQTLAKSGVAKVGDLVVHTLRGGGHTIQSENSKNLVFEGITIYASPSFSMYEFNCENSTYEACVLKRKENDPKVSSPRLCAGNADGIHSQNAPVGFKVRNCTARDIGDDAITITSRYYPVTKVDEAEKCVYVMSREKPVFKNGDTLVFLRGGAEIMGKTKCGEFTDAGITQSEVKDHAKLYVRNLLMQDKYIYGTKVKLDPWIKELKAGDVFNAVERSGRGFVIENNFAGYTRARGIFVKSSDGVIKNNTVEECALAGIVLAQELNYMSGGCFENIEIANNTVKNCLLGGSNSLYTQAGAISVISANAQFKFSAAGAFKNITVTGNTVEGCPLPCILLTSIDGLTFKDNVIKPNFDAKRTWGQAIGVLNTQEVFEANVVQK